MIPIGVLAQDRKIESWEQFLSSAQLVGIAGVNSTTSATVTVDVSSVSGTCYIIALRAADYSIYKLKNGTLTRLKYSTSAGARANLSSGSVFLTNNTGNPVSYYGGTLCVVKWPFSEEDIEEWLIDGMAYVSTASAGRSTSAEDYSASVTLTKLADKIVFASVGDRMDIYYSVSSGDISYLFSSSDPGVETLVEHGSSAYISANGTTRTTQLHGGSIISFAEA